MTTGRKVRVIGSLIALALMVSFLLGVPQRWWAKVSERPPPRTAVFICSNERCAIRFEAEVREEVETRCPECMWLASPETGEP